MKKFESLLKSSKEIGYVEEIHGSLVSISGIPGAKPEEVLMFESGQMGQVFSLSKDSVEALLLTSRFEKVGTTVARTGDRLSVQIGKSMLGMQLNALGVPMHNKQLIGKGMETRYIEMPPENISKRALVREPLETGVSISDLLIPLGRGQRQLIIGDRKTGKTGYIMKALATQAKAGAVCIYAAIGRKQVEIADIIQLINQLGVQRSTILVSSGTDEPPGKVFMTPYTAMTIAEYFRDQGFHVFLVLDDLTRHAKYYREVSLLSKRFPGRDSYPGDIFYIHSKLLERAGSFLSTTITCMPVVESQEGDLSGYIQTNIMSMTDCHVFFDANLFAEGKRPAINPFLSVSRVGRQAHSALIRSLSLDLYRFLVKQKKLRELMQFGAELNEQVKQELALGDRIDVLFFQPEATPTPLNVSVIILSALWAGLWKGIDTNNLEEHMNSLTKTYSSDSKVRSIIDQVLKDAKSFSELVNLIKRNDGRIGNFSLNLK